MAKGVEEEFKEIEKEGWVKTLQDIKREADEHVNNAQITSIEAKRIQNFKLNRYQDVLPYDQTRVKLQTRGFDYINASLVRCERANRKYILCQGPLRITLPHFWLMVWEQNSKAILMLNKVIEDNHVKCYKYWPDDVDAGALLDLPEVGLTVKLLDTTYYTNFCVRNFKVTHTDSTKSREVLQFHYTQWPDFGIPQTPDAFLKFLKHVRAAGVLENNVGPAIVHCSAGIGRSGTFCLVDCGLIVLDQCGKDNVSLREILLELRKHRLGLIQTADQLYFAYRAVIEGKQYLKNNTLDLLEDEQIADPEQANNSANDLEAPPPLPKRTNSLKNPANSTILTQITTTNNDSDKSSSPRHHHTTTTTAESNYNERELPPLPTTTNNSSTLNSNGNTSNVEFADDSSSDEYEDEEEIPSLNTDEEDDEDGDGSEIIGADNKNDVAEVNVADDNENSGNDAPEISRDESTVPSPISDDGPESAASLRRRYRQEKNQMLSDQIQNIKRKTQETSESAAKKRRQSGRAK